MDDYLEIGGSLAILPAIATFFGGWWYCAATYGFLLGFGLGWLPSLILAAMVQLAVAFLWGPALALVLIGFVVHISDTKENRAAHEAKTVIADEPTKAKSDGSVVASEKVPIIRPSSLREKIPDYSKMSDEEFLAAKPYTSKNNEPDYSKMSDEELLKLFAAECGKEYYEDMSINELKELVSEC